MPAIAPGARPPLPLPAASDADEEVPEGEPGTFVTAAGPSSPVAVALLSGDPDIVAAISLEGVNGSVEAAGWALLSDENATSRSGTLICLRVFWRVLQQMPV